MRRLLAVALLVSATPAFATQAVAVSVEELARASTLVVRGKVLSTAAQKTDDGKRIYTTVELRADKVLRGLQPPRIRVVVPGGVVGRLGQKVDGAPEFTTGEEVVVFLGRSGDMYRVTGLAQGKFTISGGMARPDLTHLTFIRTSVSAGERRAEEMPLAELERRVRSTR